MHRVGARSPAGLKNCLDVEVALRTRRRPHQVGFVGKVNVGGVGIGL